MSYLEHRRAASLGIVQQQQMYNSADAVFKPGRTGAPGRATQQDRRHLYASAAGTPSSPNTAQVLPSPLSMQQSHFSGDESFARGGEASLPSRASVASSAVPAAASSSKYGNMAQRPSRAAPADRREIEASACVVCAVRKSDFVW
jgi:hypothetical protein